MDNLPVLTVRRVEKNAQPSLNFSDKPWTDIPAHKVGEYMGKEPLHQPQTQFKIGYHPDFILIVYKVADKFVRARATHYQGSVYQDSCVEFFFSPNPDISAGYFNLEVNCCGQALFEFHPANDGPMIPIPETVFNTIEISHHLSGTIEPEHEDPLTWSVAFRIPLDGLSTFCPVTRPGPGVSWRANFHKCADLCSHPHWLSWAKVDHPNPKFHMPEYFGRIEFE